MSPSRRSAARGGIGPQMVFLGLIFMAQGFVIFTAIALCSGTLGNYLMQKPQAGRYFSWLSAAILFSLGIRLAMAVR